MIAVSIIVPTYNSGEFIEDALDSALSQTIDDYEIVVVDDGSTDNTKEILKKYQGKIVYFYQENQGLSAARNSGVGLAQGRYIQLLDADDIILPAKLEKQVEFLDGAPEVGVDLSDFKFIRDFDKDRWHDTPYVHYDEDLWEKLIPNGLLEEEFIIPPVTTLIRKECIERVGGFSVTLQACEDWEFWLRVIAAGYKFHYTDVVLALYRQHGAQMTEKKVRMAIGRLGVVKAAIRIDRERGSGRKRALREALAECYHRLGIALIESGRRAAGYAEIARAYALLLASNRASFLKTVWREALRLMGRPMAANLEHESTVENRE